MSNTIRKISTREFVRTLKTHGANIFLQGINPDVEKVRTSMETTIGFYPSKVDTVKKANFTNVIFDSGMSISLTGKGKREYYKFVNGAGIEFVMQKTISRDELCDELDMDRVDYTVYAVAA